MARKPESTEGATGSDGVRIIAMLNQKGGVGKTTSTVNLGAALAASGQRVCLLDLDPQGHLTLHLGVDEGAIKHTIYDLLVDPDVTAKNARLNAKPNLDAILAVVDLAAAETELANEEDRHTILRDKMQPILKDYDVVIIDCPPSLGLLTLNALALAKEVFVPMQAHFLALQGVGRLLETVGLVSQEVNPALRVTGIILCMHEAQTTLAREIVADMDGFFEAARATDVPWRDCRVLRPPIRRNIKLAEAPSFGKTIFDYEPTCQGAADYRQLADELLGSWGKAPPSTRVPERSPTIQLQNPSSGDAPRSSPPEQSASPSDAATAPPISPVPTTAPPGSPGAAAPPRANSKPVAAEPREQAVEIEVERAMPKVAAGKPAQERASVEAKPVKATSAASTTPASKAATARPMPANGPRVMVPTIHTIAAAVLPKDVGNIKASATTSTVSANSPR